MNRLRSLKHSIHIGESVLLTIAVFISGFVVGHFAHFPIVALSDTEQAFEVFWDAFDIIEARFVDQVEVDLLVDGAIDGMVKALEDDNSGYIRPEFYRRSIDFSGEFSGIGVIIETNDETGEIEVVDCGSGFAGRRGRCIFPVMSFSKLMVSALLILRRPELSAIVPGPRGTTVTIIFKRGEEFVTFEIVRDVFTLPNRLVGNCRR